MKKTIRLILAIIFSTFICIYRTPITLATVGNRGLGVSPMNQKIILNPGDTYIGSFEITNPANNTEPFLYKLEVRPFYVDENYSVYYDEMNNFNQIVNWTTLEKEDGRLEVNDVETVYFTVNVPNNAPSGGQYMVIMVQSNSQETDEKTGNVGINLQQNIGIAHVVYAEIAGTNVHRGEVEDINVPSFLFNGDICGSSLIKNLGNVHGTATYTLQVFPIFSNEEVYTNEESPATATILPERSRYNETVWENTPPIGIFNVIYTVEFEGTTAQVKKMVIKCPIWLLFIIIFAIIALIMYFFVRSKNRKNNKKCAPSAKAE